MNRAVRGTNLFLTSDDFTAFARILREELYESRVEILSYQVMRNHWHLVMTCERIADLSVFMHRFEGRHANNWAGAHDARGKGYVYQGRFKAVPVQTSHSLLRVCRYVERNALRQHLVAAAEDWEWGSLHARCNNYYPIPLAEWPILRPSNWTELVNTPQTADELAELRNRITRDHPIGDPRWVEAVAPFVGLTLRPRGRPKK
ncbi:MAG TPA: transposase [Vicinamibacterales bacterium]|nr:transposase [Vicinamibacterales bacterium]